MHCYAAEQKIIKRKNKDMQEIKELTPETKKGLLETLANRFHKNMGRHADIVWADVLHKLEQQPQKLWSLFQMEESGGEPDVVVLEPSSKDFTFVDCSAESPKGRRSICFDQAALLSRKEFRPADSAAEMAKAMGIEMLDELQYRRLQEFGAYDTKTSSWIQTPDKIRKLGGALFCDRRYDTVFLYHNGAESYYAVRGFRGMLVL